AIFAGRFEDCLAPAHVRVVERGARSMAADPGSPGRFRTMTPVVHVVDALNIGGAERVAINLVNLLPRDRYVPYLCTTRSEGPLSQFVAPHVTRLRLERRGTFDTAALRQFVRFIAERRIGIVHAHASALFF